MIALARLEHKPPRLDLNFYPYLPRANVSCTDTRSYMGLLSAKTDGGIRVSLDQGAVA
jgi:hypothetical protein